MLERGSLVAPLLAEEGPADDAPEPMLRWSRDSADDLADRAAVKFKASVFYWQLGIHLLQPFSTPLVLLRGGCKTATNLRFILGRGAAAQHSAHSLFSILAACSIWCLNILLISPEVRAQTVLVVQLVLMNCFVGVQKYLIAAKYSLMTHADYSNLMQADDEKTERLRAEVTLVAGWAVPSRSYVVDEFQRSLRRTHCPLRALDNLSISHEHSETLCERLAAASIVHRSAPGEATVVSVEQMFVMLTHEVLTKTGCYPTSETTTSDKPSTYSPFLKRWRVWAFLLGLVM